MQLDDGTRLSWDDIETARLAEDKQAEFERLRKELGEPLYRIRQRLSVGDYRGALPHAEAVYRQYADRESPTAYMVVQALMWGRLAAGRREEALEPYLRCVEYLRRMKGSVSLPGERRLAHDPKTGLSPELLPVWFDERAAQTALACCIPGHRANAAATAGGCDTSTMPRWHWRPVSRNRRIER